MGKAARRCKSKEYGAVGLGGLRFGLRDLGGQDFRLGALELHRELRPSSGVEGVAGARVWEVSGSICRNGAIEEQKQADQDLRPFTGIKRFRVGPE